ncbi:MAG: hypothetical protein MUD10_02325 [Candidatus Pacebacteria bacterium]|jgi:hypothetical protein|nr:hypothetical protein [Candidatus Paceibacterota bacterium]
MNKDDYVEMYYKELQATLRNYDDKLWKIPTLFFGIIALSLNGIKFHSYDREDIIKNVAILLFSLIFLLWLIPLFNKAKFFHLSIQKKINELDNSIKEENKIDIKTIPLSSMNPEEFRKRMNDLEDKAFNDSQRISSSKFSEGATFGPIQKLLFHIIISRLIYCTMMSVWFIYFLLLIENIEKYINILN